MPPQQGHDYFTELPLELLQEIASHLPLFHKLKLRTIFKKQQVDVVVALLGNGIRNLYVCPTSASLGRFTNICESSFFQQHVKEICFVPYAIAPEYLSQRLSFRQYRDTFPRFSESEALMSFGTYNSVVDEHQAGSDPGLQSQSDVIGILQAGLVKMTQVDTMSVQCITQEDGMNSYALHHGRKYRENNEDKLLTPTKAMGDIRTAAMETSVDLLKMVHIEAFVKAVRDSGITLRHFALGRYTLGQYHVAQLPGDFQTCVGLTPATIASILDRVTELTISCRSIIRSRSEEGIWFWQKVAESASKIKHLTMSPCTPRRSKGWTKPGREVEVIDQFLAFGHYHDLQSLVLKGRLCCPQVVDLQKLEVFLFKHRRTLREVRLYGIRVSISPEDARESDQDKTACDSLRSLATNVRTWIPNLQTFEMKIARRSRYLLYGNHWMAGSKMKALAADMGVELGKDKAWDFGKVASERK